MKDSRAYRINGFEQIKAFYSWVFNNQDKEIGTSHIALYNFLVNQNNRSNWVEWFKVPYDLGMAGSCIGSRNTYYKCLKDLQAWELIEYKPGINNYKAPIIKLCLLNNEQVTEHVPVPLSEHVTEHVNIPLTEPLTEHIYKLITNNLKRITDNLPEVVKFLDEIEKQEIIDYKLILESYRLYCPNLRSVKSLSEERKKHISARFKEHGNEAINEMLKKAGSSEFLSGKNDRCWKADLDWIFNPTNFLKILEGKYDSKELSLSQTQTSKIQIKTTRLDEIR